MLVRPTSSAGGTTSADTVQERLSHTVTRIKAT